MTDDETDQPQSQPSDDSPPAEEPPFPEPVMEEQEKGIDF
jgi:hypothetical protein